MERKRKLPARAAARAEQPPKKRNITPREHSTTPAPTEPTPDPGPPPPSPLPTSVQPGKPLPTVEKGQSQDLSDEEYQSVGESGVLTESLSRSRSKWVNEGLFEKYWTKPHKRKGVVVEDPKNPPKDTMTRIGNVTITIEPHIIDAVMYTVKKPPQLQTQQQQAQQQQAQQQQAQQQQARPILQYGPANNGYAAASASPSAKAESPAPAVGAAIPPPRNSTPGTTAAPVGVSGDAPPQLSPSTAALTSAGQPQRQTPLMAPPPPPLPSGMTPPPPGRSPMAQQPSGLAHPAAAPAAAPPPQPPPRNSTAASPLQHPGHPPAVPVAGAASSQQPGVTPPQPGQPSTPKPGTTKPSPDDPVIALLAERASKDETLRNLMKRVAMGKAGDIELVHFQRIIDQLNVECKAKQVAAQPPARPPGPPAERLSVDGRTVKYFADEVRTILGIVLTSNPNQKSADLRPPPRSDPLVVLLVKTALEDTRTKDMINRIADGRPGPNDGQDLKDIIDRLHKDMKTSPAGGLQPAAQPVTPSQGGQLRPQQNLQSLPGTGGQQQNPQALRSKGPPPAPKPDISDVVFDFGSGDRYLFPKYSIVEYVSVPAGQQLLVSFLLVRKGSFAEYGGDPKLDYYQPVTIRLSVSHGRSLDNINRIVAPQEEVRRYMDDVMDHMTRSEFLLLAMRLPRKESEPEKDKDKDGMTAGDRPPAKSSVATPKAETATPEANAAAAKPAVLWAAPKESSRPLDPAHALKMRQAEEETQAQYQRLIQSVTAKATEAV